MKRTSRMLPKLAALLCAFPALGYQPPGNYLFSVEPGTLLIENAMLPGQGKDGKPQPVNLLIEKGQLKLVSANPLPEEDTEPVVDAKKGVVLGKLGVGEPASFIILDKDPMEDFEALLDTKTHAVFVIRDGFIVRNRLLKPKQKEAQKKKSQGWFAYNPPPFALPTSYGSSKKWNHFSTRYVNGALVAGVLLDRTKWLHQDDASKAQVGDLSPYDEGEIRALRFGLIGTFNFDTPWTYTVFVATHAFDQGYDSDGADDPTLFDCRLDVPLSQDISLSVGKQKEPISMERLMTLIDLPMLERATVSDAMMPSRNVGVVLNGTALDQRTSWAAGVFNPWLDQGGSISDNPTQIIGRWTVLPLESEDEGTLLHLGAGLRYSTANQGVRYRSTPEFHSAPDFVDTGRIPADNTLLCDLEAACRWGPMLLNGEYVFNQLDAPNDPFFSGFHITASYVLTGEMRPYNKRSGIFSEVPVARPVQSGGWGSWEVAARYSTVDLQDGGIDGGDMDIYSLGLNWKLNSAAGMSLDYRHVILDKDAETGHSDGLLMRITLMLE